MIVQFATEQLRNGSGLPYQPRPVFLLPQDTPLPGHSFLGKYKQAPTLRGDIPEQTSFNGRKGLVFYRDYELFCLITPLNKRDVLCATTEWG
ncbi:hypothetical protein AJ78_08656 [Emergomyces pasteurianus Ep9510]|uniref:Uncharacterized protein n=1 Tax=Emergomyces pasteurianus Ep9510 TaxID=1447872 RepID=A0A1J9P0D2_9EURO|nr:hypothetical protein AJ78_08656 [Emergomyces pasteurianus Ep9510]